MVEANKDLHHMHIMDKQEGLYFQEEQSGFCLVCWKVFVKGMDMECQEQT